MFNFTLRRRVSDLEDELEASLIRVMVMERTVEEIESTLFEMDARLQSIGKK